MRIFTSGIATALIVTAVTFDLTGVYGQPQARSLTFQADKPKVAVITCMHPFLNMDFLLKQLNLTQNNSYILRNAGGRAKAAIRSVLVSQEFLGTSEVHVIHHTQCGMAGQSEESMRQKFYRADDKYRADMLRP
ncbi:carbonic anhydrase [Rhizoctonia solani 123E]|uniref:Carbonic anhydrase n=1 Tax=Rhizoctonia solani 123E TaxID=1423351 RepID=A0A074RW00_9AGAM|nr:carbonic anhydrase [Rhizoctonia solani 123E]